MRCIQLIPLLISVTSFAHADEKPLLCSLCDCIPLTNNASFLQVKCLSDVKSTLFPNSNKSDPSNNPIQRLIIRNNDLFVLTKPFEFETLVELDLSENKIKDIDGAVFAKLQKLERLVLSRNNIVDLGPEAFKGQYIAGEFFPLEALRTLMLDENNLKGLQPDVFEHIDKIEHLSLAHNPLNIIDDHTAIAITNLLYLKHLDLSYTEIAALPKYFLHTPKHISVLNLSGNAFTEIPKELEEAQSLETLVFNENLLVNLTSENAIPRISTLRVLHLCLMPKLEVIGPGSLANLDNLTDLYIALNPRLTRIDESALARRASDNGTYISWPGIKKLYLNDNQLSYLNASFVARWDALAELDLSRNPWTCECENQWIVETLMPIYLKIDEEKAKAMRCGAPIEMDSYSFEQLYREKYNMRCLDLYGARPEEDAAILVGIFAGVLLIIPVVLILIYSYKRHWFGIFDDSPAAFSRQFYGKTNNDLYDY